jgi:hypothetical protein
MLELAEVTDKETSREALFAEAEGGAEAAAS